MGPGEENLMSKARQNKTGESITMPIRDTRRSKILIIKSVAPFWGVIPIFLVCKTVSLVASLFFFDNRQQVFHEASGDGNGCFSFIYYFSSDILIYIIKIQRIFLGHTNDAFHNINNQWLQFLPRHKNCIITAWGNKWLVGCVPVMKKRLTQRRKVREEKQKAFTLCALSVLVWDPKPCLCHHKHQITASKG